MVVMLESCLLGNIFFSLTIVLTAFLVTSDMKKFALVGAALLRTNLGLIWPCWTFLSLFFSLTLQTAGKTYNLNKTSGISYLFRLFNREATRETPIFMVNGTVPVAPTKLRIPTLWVAKIEHMQNDENLKDHKIFLDEWRQRALIRLQAC